MHDIEQVMQELAAFGQLQDALEKEQLRSIGRQLHAEHAYHKLVLTKYGIAVPFAPEADDAND